MIERTLLDHFLLLGNPSTKTAQQRGEMVRAGRIHHYEKKEVTAAKAELSDKLFDHVPDKPYDGPLSVMIQWRFEIKDKKRWATLKTTKPDVDNLAKGLLDVMTKMGFWEDDNQIAELILRKSYTCPEDGNIEIRISRLEVVNDGVD